MSHSSIINRNMKEGAMKMKKGMAMEKQHYQIQIHMKECMTVGNDTVKVYTGKMNKIFT